MEKVKSKRMLTKKQMRRKLREEYKKNVGGAVQSSGLENAIACGIVITITCVAFISIFLLMLLIGVVLI